MELKIIPQTKVRWGVSVFVSCGCCNTFLKTWWLKTTGNYSPILLKARRPKSVLLSQNQGVSRDARVSGGSKRESVPCFYQLLMAVGIPWLVAPSLQSPPPRSRGLLLFRLHQISVL